MKYFGKRKYAEHFMQGKIYMNDLGYFWNPLNGYAEQHDIHEGIALATNKFKVQDEYNIAEYMMSDPMFRAEGYKYCNVACFYRVDAKTFPMPNNHVLVDWQSYANMKEFGNFVVIIKDVEEFIRRIDVAVKENNFKYGVGDVKYYEDIKPDVHCTVLQSDTFFDIRRLPQGRKYDSFHKAYKFENQKEWRISLYRGIKEEKACTLKIGDLHDITHLSEIRNVVDDFGYLLERGEIKPNWDYRYKGNVKQEELRDLFIALGDYQAKLSLIVKKDYLAKLPPPQRGDFLERFAERLINTLNDTSITKEERYAEVERLRDVLKRSYTRVFYENKEHIDEKGKNE